MPETLKAVLLMQSGSGRGCDGGGKGALVQEDKSGTLGTGNDQTIAGCNGKGWREDTSYTLNTIDRPAVCAGVRCLTPWEAQSARVYDQDGVWHSLNANENGGMARDSVMCLNDQGGSVMGASHDVSGTLRAQEHGHQSAVMAFAQNQREEVRNVGDKAVALAAEVGMHCQTFVALDMPHACDVIRDCGEVAPSLQDRMGTGGNQMPLTFAFGRSDALVESDVASTQSARQGKSATDLVCAVDCRNFREGGETNWTLQAKSNGGISYNLQNTVRTGMIVRRLTPMECERLQGFPDHWTDIGEWMDSKGKRHKDADSPRYKALGNSIALPFWQWLIDRMAAYLPEGATMGSLFDGIGGFPLCWQRTHGDGTAKWASEIEQFPIAVTKLRFGED